MNFPCTQDGQQITAGPTSAVAALAGDANRVLAAQDILLWNPGPYEVTVRAGGTDAVATAVSPVLPAGALWAYRKGASTHLATRCASGSQAIVVWLGEGA
jgi:hypothetical protein